jgi:hypothetical protein
LINKNYIGKILSLMTREKLSNHCQKDGKKVAALEHAAKASQAEKKERNNSETIVMAKTEKGPKEQDPSGTACEEEYACLTPVERIYENNKIARSPIGTIFMAESYLKTLPDHLPGEVKRRTVLDLIRSTGVSIDQLCKDGDRRIRALEDYLRKFSETTDKLVSEHQMEMKRLRKRIEEHEKAISKRKNLQKEQTAIVNYELERLQRIADFLKENAVGT